MGKHFVAETMRQLEQQARRQYREDDDQRDQDYQDWFDSRREREIETMRGDW